MCRTPFRLQENSLEIQDCFQKVRREGISKLTASVQVVDILVQVFLKYRATFSNPYVSDIESLTLGARTKIAQAKA